MQSEETIRALMSYSNDVALGIDEVAQLFRKNLENHLQAQEGLKYHLNVLEDYLHGESSESFDFINGHFTKERTSNFEAIEKLSDLLNYHVSFLQEKMNQVKNL